MCAWDPNILYVLNRREKRTCCRQILKTFLGLHTYFRDTDAATLCVCGTIIITASVTSHYLARPGPYPSPCRPTLIIRHHCLDVLTPRPLESAPLQTEHLGHVRVIDLLDAENTSRATVIIMRPCPRLRKLGRSVEAWLVHVSEEAAEEPTLAVLLLVEVAGPSRHVLRPAVPGLWVVQVDGPSLA